MKLLNRSIPFIISLIIFFSLETIIRNPKQIYWQTPLLLMLLILGVWLLTGREFKKLRFWNFLITPFLLLLSGLSFIIFIESFWLKHILIATLAILLGVFLEATFLYFRLRPKYQAHSLENISNYLNLLIVFLVFSSFFSSIVFLEAAFWQLILPAAIICFLLSYQITEISDIAFYRSWPYIVIITLILVELFWAVNFLPTSIYVNSLILTLAYYLMMGLSRNWLLGIIDKRVTRRYLIISLSCFILILITAKWV